MKKKPLINLMFNIAYFMYIYSIFGVRVTFTKQLIEIFKICIPIVLLVICLIQGEKYSIKTILGILAVICLSVISNFYTKNSTFLYLAGFIIASKDIQNENIIKYDIKIKIFSLIFIIICCWLGLADNVISYRNDGTIRYSLGFNHPNTIGMCLFSICCGIMYLYYNKQKPIKYILPLLAYIGCTYICDSRASQIGIIILIILSIIMPKIQKNKITKFMFQNMHIILFILSIFITILYSNGFEIAKTLDKVFNTRIYWMSRFYNYYGLNMFGHFFSDYGVRGYNVLGVLDNAYIHLIIHYGLFITIVIFVSLTIFLKKAYQEKNMNIFIYIIPVFIYGLMEKNIFEPIVNVMMIFLNSLLYFKKEYILQKEKTK